MVEFQTTQTLVSEVPQRVEVTAHSWIRVANCCSETTLYVASNLQSATPERGFPIHPGETFGWDVVPGDARHAFYLVAPTSFSDQIAAIGAR